MEAGFPERPVIGLLLHAAAARVEEHWARLTSPAEFEALRASLVRLLAEPSDRWRVRVRRAQPSPASTAAAALSQTGPRRPYIRTKVARSLYRPSGSGRQARRVRARIWSIRSARRACRSNRRSSVPAASRAPGSPPANRP